MTDTLLTYRANAMIEDLAVGECVMRPCSSPEGNFWHLWFRVLRDIDGQPEVFCVPMNPRGSFLESGPGGKTWGLECPDATAWERSPDTKNWLVSPSINVLHTRDLHPGEHEEPSLWHHTPAILDVPEDEPWACGKAP